MDRETIIAEAKAAYDSTPGTHDEKIRGMLLAVVESLRADHLMVNTGGGTQFVLKMASAGTVEAGRPAHPDALAFAASMEAAIASAKGGAQDPDGKTLPQLVAALKTTAATIPGLIDAGNPAPVLAAVIQLAAIATVIQARMA